MTTTLAHTMLGDIVLTDGILYFTTRCCGASHKGSRGGVVCRACYHLVTGPHAGWGALYSNTAAAAQLADILRPSLEDFADRTAASIFGLAADTVARLAVPVVTA